MILLSECEVSDNKVLESVSYCLICNGNSMCNVNQTNKYGQFVVIQTINQVTHQKVFSDDFSRNKPSVFWPGSINSLIGPFATA